MQVALSNKCIPIFPRLFFPATDKQCLLDRGNMKKLTQIFFLFQLVHDQLYIIQQQYLLKPTDTIAALIAKDPRGTSKKPGGVGLQG